jgi:hypothetical protein
VIEFSCECPLNLPLRFFFLSMIANPDVTVFILDVMKRLIGLEMVNGIDELFGIFVFIGTEGYFKVFFCEVWYRISF